MFGSSVLDVAIGLVFVYLFVSLITTAANEMIANFLNSRGKSLWDGISAMLETAPQLKQIATPVSETGPKIPGPQQRRDSVSSAFLRLWNILMARLGSPSAATQAGNSWATKLYQHPMIRALFPLKVQGNEAVSGPKGQGPSYIPPSRFATALLDVTGVWDYKIKQLQNELQRRLEQISPTTGTGQQIRQALEGIRSGFGSASEATGIEEEGEKLMSNILAELPDTSKQLELLNKIASRFAGSRELGQLRTTLANLSLNFSRDGLATVIGQIPDQGSDFKSLRDDLENLLHLVDQNQAALEAALESTKAFAGSMASRSVRQKIEALDRGDLRQALLTLFEEAEGDVEKLKTNVEGWFKDTMDRVSGWYKRKSVWVNFGTGAVIAICLNVDTIVLLRYLSTHSTESDALVKEAEGFVKNPGGAVSGPLKSPSAGVTDADGKAGATAQPSQQPGLSVDSDLLAAKISKLTLPIGWSAASAPGADSELRGSPDWQSLFKLEQPEWAKLLNTVTFHFAGWLLTAVAISLGAPFWFDLLNKFINIRAAGKLPEEKIGP
jgi:hypothetical protein